MPKEQRIRKIELTPEELKEIVREHYKSPDARVAFSVKGFNDPDDWRAEFPLDYRLDSITVSIKEEG